MACIVYFLNLVLALYLLKVNSEKKRLKEPDRNLLKMIVLHKKLRIFAVLVTQNFMMFIYYLFPLDLPQVYFGFKAVDLFLRQLTNYFIIYFVLAKASKPIRNENTYKTWFCALNSILLISMAGVSTMALVALIALLTS